jgi:twinkle protein
MPFLNMWSLPMNSDTSANEFVRHEACPSCSSSDAFAIYSDGGGYCFSCGHHRKGDGQSTPTNQGRPTRMIQYSGDYASLRKRKISEETCKKFNVRQEGPSLRFPYYASNRIVGYKERDPEKNFRWTGKNEDDELFGQHLFGSGKTIVITEGEMDALSVWEARPSWPVVSVPSGAQGAKKALQKQLTWLLGFDEIIIMFDNDEAGAKAAEECIGLFPPDRVFLAALEPYKDASEALQAGNSKAILQSIWNKKPYVPQSIIDGRDLFDLVSTPLHGRDADYPYGDLNDVSSGLRLGELVTIAAGSGTGKSTLCGEIAVNLINQGQKVGYIALEESVKRTGLRLMTVAANKPLHIDNQIDEALFKASFESTLGTGNVYLRDGFGSIDPDAILNDIRYLVKSNEVQWVILDHLSILVSGNDSGDERKLIDVTMTKLRSFVEETGIGMILISHLRKIQGDKGHEDGASVSVSHLRGSNAILQLSDIIVGLERNISSGDNKSCLKVLKNRFNGQTGPAGNLAYDVNTGRLQTDLNFNPTTATAGDPFSDF